MASIDQTRGLAQKLANQLGIELTQLGSNGPDPAQLATFLLSRKVTLVFDVGADVGQYGRELRAQGYRGRIISFEPFSGAHAKLQKGAANDPDWIVPPRTAIGSEEGVISITASPNSLFGSSVSGSTPGSIALGVSSLSPVSAKLIAACDEQVPLVTLNSLAPQYMKRGDVVFLKVDVDGFEYEVLHGASKILDAVCGVQLKLSPVPPYHAGKPFRFMLDFMESNRFSLYSLASAFAGDTAARAMQFDAIFVRHQANAAL